MKDIRKLKIWPYLVDQNFQVKEIREGKHLFGRGAVLQVIPHEPYPNVIIKPLLNGRWYLEFNEKSKSYDYMSNAYEIDKLVRRVLPIFLNDIKSQNHERNNNSRQIN